MIKSVTITRAAGARELYRLTIGKGGDSIWFDTYEIETRSDGSKILCLRHADSLRACFIVGDIDNKFA